MERLQGSGYVFTITNTGHREPSHRGVHGKQRLSQNYRRFQRRLTRLSPRHPALPSSPRGEVHTHDTVLFLPAVELAFQRTYLSPTLVVVLVSLFGLPLTKPKLKQGQVEPSGPLLLDKNLNHAHKEISTNRK